MSNPSLIIERFQIGEAKYVWTILEDRGDRFIRLGQTGSKKRAMEIIAAQMDRLDKRNKEIYSDLYD